VQLEAGVLQQPVLDGGRLVGGVVVQDQVQVQVLRDGLVDQLEELQELLMPVAAVGLGDDRAAGQVEGGEQAGRAVADVVVGNRRWRRGQQGQAGGRSGPGPGSGTSRPRTAPGRSPAGSCRGRRRRGPCR